MPIFKDFVSKIMRRGGLTVPADNYTISTPPVKFVYPDMTDAESSKGAILEWGGDR